MLLCHKVVYVYTRRLFSLQQNNFFDFVDKRLPVSNMVYSCLKNHINSTDQHIQFTCEEQREDGSIPFLDVLVIPNQDGSLNSTVFRKPTHNDLYLQWDSHHTVPSKYSVIGTLLHRGKTISSDP